MTMSCSVLHSYIMCAKFNMYICIAVSAFIIRNNFILMLSFNSFELANCLNYIAVNL